MPYETVSETVVRQRQVRVCTRCRARLPEAVGNRGAVQTGGSLAGSLGGSMGGSMLLGSVLGPVGSVVGAIGGALAGSRVGAEATDAACNVVESTSSELCDRCKQSGNTGGNRLGGSASSPAAASDERGIGEQIGDTAKKAADSVENAFSSAWSWAAGPSTSAKPAAQTQGHALGGTSAAASGIMSHRAICHAL